MKKKLTIEEQLTEAFYSFKSAESDVSYTENLYFNAEMAYRQAWHDYNQAFYDYVRQGSPENHARQHQASEHLSVINQRANEAKLNYKLALCRFKKAKKLYEKLKRKQGKTQGKQPGEI